jgi:hypothetical protein
MRQRTELSCLNANKQPVRAEREGSDGTLQNCRLDDKRGDLRGYGRIIKNTVGAGRISTGRLSSGRISTGVLYNLSQFMIGCRKILTHNAPLIIVFCALANVIW